MRQVIEINKQNPIIEPVGKKNWHQIEEF